MDFRLNAEQLAFRGEVRQFLQHEAGKEVLRESESGAGFGPYTWELLRKVGAKRWLAPHWPEKHGGMGASYIHRLVIQEEMAYYSGVETLVAVSMAGPVVLRRGSEEQKDYFLPRIARGEIEFALGYTEPQAGSDLAALEIKAVDKGDHFLVSGQKVFNTASHYAQYHWLGARTDFDVPKHKGISLFMVDFKSPGIEIRPIWTIGTRTNEVFYDNVRVPRSAMVGEKNRGWDYINEALVYERNWITGSTRRALERMVKYAATTRRNGKTIGSDPLVRQRIAELAIEVEISALFGMRNACMLDHGQLPSYEAPMAKFFGSELHNRLTAATLQMMGEYGQLMEGSKWAPNEGMAPYVHLDSMRMVLTRGTSEIMKNLIAMKGLQLPRG